MLINHASLVCSLCTASFCIQYIICYMLLTPIGAKVPIMACWRAGKLCGLDAHASPAHPGAVARFCGCIFIPSVLNAPHLFHAALCLKWHMNCQIPPFSKAGIVILTLTVILLIGIKYCLHVVNFVNGLFVIFTMPCCIVHIGYLAGV